jgi:uncharacterized protein Yka (UPF0111/DUF47 family)
MAVILDEYGKYSIKLENGDTAGGYLIDAVFKEMEKLQKKVEALEQGQSAFEKSTSFFGYEGDPTILKILDRIEELEKRLDKMQQQKPVR